MERVDVVDRPMKVARSQVRYGSNVQLYRSPEVFRRAVFDDLRDFYDRIDHAVLERASQALADARNVLHVSTVADSCASSILRYSGLTWFPNWRETSAYEVGCQTFVEDISDGGVLVAIATPPHDYEVLYTAMAARDCGARVIGVTDVPEPALSIVTQDLLIAPVARRGAFNSYACIAALVEMLVVMAAARSVAPAACGAGQSTDQNR